MSSAVEITRASSEQLGRKAVRSGAILMAARFGVQGILWAVTLLVARLLTPRDYGIMSVGVVFICLAEMLAESGVGRALVQKEKLDEEDLDAAFTLNVVLSVALYAFLLVVSPLAAAFMNMPDLAVMLPVLGLMVLLGPTKAVSYALLDRDLKMERQAAIHVVFSILQSAVVVTLAFLGAGFWSLVVGAVLGRVFEVIGLYLATHWWPRIRWNLRPRAVMAGLVRHAGLVRFGMSVSFSSILLFFYNNIIFVIVGKLVGDVILGYFSLAFQIISLPMQKLTVGTNQVSYPVFCRLRDDPVTLRRWYLRLTVFLGFLGVPTLIGMALVAPEAFRLVLGEKWMPAVVPFRLLALVGVLMIYAGSLPPLLDGLGRPDLTLRYSAVCSMVFPVGTYLGAVGLPPLAGYLASAGEGTMAAEWLIAFREGLSGPQGQVVGVCLAWLVLYPMMLTGLVALTRSVTGVGVFDLLKPQLPVLLAAGCMVAAVYLVRQTVVETAGYLALVIRLAISIVTGAAVYAGVMVLVARDTVGADLKNLVRELRSGRRKEETMERPEVGGSLAVVQQV